MSSFLDYKFNNFTLDNENNKCMADTLGIPWQEVSKSENRPISEETLKTLQRYDAFLELVKNVFDKDPYSGDVVGLSRVLEIKEMKKKEKEARDRKRADSIFSVTGSVIFLGLIGLIGFLLV